MPNSNFDQLPANPKELPPITAAQRATLANSGGNVQVAIFDTSGSTNPKWYRSSLTELLAAFAGSITSASATGGVGYATGAGGTVTQATNKSTGVTLNKPTGQITMNNASLGAGAEVAFTLTNSTIAANDVVVVAIKSGGTSAAYQVGVTATAAGSCEITVSNLTAGSLGEALVLNYAVIKGVAA